MENMLLNLILPLWHILWKMYLNLILSWKSMENILLNLILALGHILWKICYLI